MIRHLTLDATFSAVPHLANTLLWQQFAKNGLALSLDKPNVVVGPNGAGKTALLTLLALRTWTYFTGETAFDDNYTRGSECDKWWSERTWRADPVFLPGAVFQTDDAPAVFYRPNHLPGNERCATTALMVGYSTEARAYIGATDKKSSGQACVALLDRIRVSLTDPVEAFGYQYVNWSGGKERRDLRAYKGYVGPWDYRAEAMKAQRDAYQAGIPMILLDEPEQSLDARAELALWQDLAAADCTSRQLVVATHSLYPFLHPEKFNLIEAEPGYVVAVRAALGGVSQL